jgi:hypothetical protein
MIIKLPIVIENKVIITKFKLLKKNNFYSLTIFESNMDYNINNDKGSMIKILLFGNNNYEFINIILPLNIYIIDSYLISIYFFNININSNFKNKMDFFNCLNIIMLERLKLSFIQKDNYNIFSSNIINFINSQYLSLVKKIKPYEIWEIINLLINSSGFIIWINNNTNNKLKLCKRISLITNTFINIKFSINFSNEYKICEHLTKFNNIRLKIDEINKNNYYFLLITDKKIFKVKVININKNLITLENFNNIVNFNDNEWYIYSPDIKINYNIIFKTFILNSQIIEKIILKFNWYDNSTKKIISYFIDSNLKSNLYQFILQNNLNNIEKTDIEIIKSKSYSYEFFKAICLKYSSNYYIILDILFSNYIYPIKYNKKEIDTIFDHILYISLLNIKHIIFISDNDPNKIFLNNNLKVPNKLKLLYFNILKTFYQLIHNNVNTVKYISDNMHVLFIKLLFTTKSLTFDLLVDQISIKSIEAFKKILVTNFFINDIIKKITWLNINNRFIYFKILLNNKDYLYFYDKLNKNMFPDNFDLRLKSLIVNPFEMFKYLKKEHEFIEWIFFLEKKCYDLYISPVSLDIFDLKILGEIIFALINIKEQNLNDFYYSKIILYAIQYPKLLLNNTRINLKINSYFDYLNYNINLGILSKHILLRKDNIIKHKAENDIEKSENNIEKSENNIEKYKNDINKAENDINKAENDLNKYENNIDKYENDIDKVNDILILKIQINKLTKKYLKYKKKYNASKNKN